MIGLVAALKIKPGMEEKVTYACLKMAEEVHKHEKDCLYYEPFINADGSSEVYFLETYRDMEALEAHRLTPHYLAYREKIKDALMEPPVVTILKQLSQ